MIENTKNILKTRRDIIEAFKKKKQIEEDDEQTEDDEQAEDDEENEDKKLPLWLQVSKARFDEIKKIVTDAKKKLQLKLLKNKVISMTKISKLINRIDKDLDLNKKTPDKETHDMYMSINDDLNFLNEAMVKTGLTNARNNMF